MEMRKEGIERLALWEGNRKFNGMHYPYDDYDGQMKQLDESVRGYLTLGYGHLLRDEERNAQFVVLDDDYVNFWQGLTESQAQVLLHKDLRRFELAVNRHVDICITDYQYEALVSFSFNVGVGAFTDSTLLRILNEGDFDGVPAQFRRWNKSGGQVVQGLINRREHEIQHWNGDNE